MVQTPLPTDVEDEEMTIDMDLDRYHKFSYILALASEELFLVLIVEVRKEWWEMVGALKKMIIFLV